MDSMEIDKIVTKRLNAVEETIKQAVELILDAHSQCSMITYLILAHKDIEKNSSKTAIRR